MEAKRKNRTIKNWIKLIIFGLITIIMMYVLADVLTTGNKLASTNIAGFYQEDKNSVDLVVVGASETYTGYNPIYAWEEFGYTSYVLGTPGLPANLYISLVKEVLRNQDPKVVCIEINGFLHGDNYLKRDGSIRNVVDNLKWSENRIDAINRSVEKEDRGYFYFPLASYHSSWMEPKSVLSTYATKTQIRLHNESVLKGFATYSYTYEVSEYKSKEKIELTPDCEKYLVELVEYLKDSGVENVIFYRAPHAYSAKNADELDKVNEIVTDNGFEFLNLEGKLDEIGLDIKTDFYNVDHMNIFGCEKFTHYFGQYMTENSLVEPTTDEDIIKKWNDQAKRADEIFDRCKTDTLDCVPYHYTEDAVYSELKEVTNIEKELRIKPEEFRKKR